MDENRVARDADPHYDDTAAPQNPPNSMVNRDARTGWLASSVGVLAIVFFIVAGGFVWVMVERNLGKGGRVPDAPTVGTSGEIRRERSPGGFNPTPRPGSTRDELEFRGDTAQAASAGANDVTDPARVASAPVGSRVRLMGVTVARSEGNTFWIRTGNTTIAVVSSGDSPTVRAGQQVNVTGTTEADGSAVRVRASRIDVI
jgi:hypothetical protein